MQKSSLENYAKALSNALYGAMYLATAGVRQGRSSTVLFAATKLFTAISMLAFPFIALGSTSDFAYIVRAILQLSGMVAGDEIIGDIAYSVILILVCGESPDLLH